MEKSSWLENIIDAFGSLGKWGILIMSLVLGTLGKFSYNMLNGHKLTWAQALGQAGVCVVCGTLAWMFCNYMEWVKAAGIITTVATYVSDKIMLALYSLDWKSIMNNLIDVFRKKRD